MKIVSNQVYLWSCSDVMEANSYLFHLKDTVFPLHIFLNDELDCIP